MLAPHLDLNAGEGFTMKGTYLREQNATTIKGVQNNQGINNVMI
jgi:hypothetical protein